MAVLGSKVGPLLSPLAYAAGRSLENRFPGASTRLNDVSLQLDWTNQRALMRRATQSGRDTSALLKLQVALELAASCSTAADIVLSNLSDSASQLLQDVFVLVATLEKHHGTFAEIGVGDGRYLSNSFLLERRYGWTGVLAEPNPAFHVPIRSSRSASLDERAVCGIARGTTQLLADENQGELSTLLTDGNPDQHTRTGVLIDVDTVGVNDFLSSFVRLNGPLDYLSVDTEGSEADIVGAIDFGTYRPLVLTIEHNYVAAKAQAVDDVMLSAGYRRVLRKVSRFDGWYVRADVGRSVPG